MNEIIFNFFYSLAHVNPFLDGVIIFVAKYYGIIITAVLFLYLYDHKDKKKGVKDLFVVLTAAISAWGFAHILKLLFYTLRPFDVLPGVHALVLEPTYAFPSGHAMFFMALASALWFYHKDLAVFFGASAILIGIARIASGTHWPVDILGGLVIGCFVGVGVYHILARVLQKGRKSLY